MALVPSPAVVRAGELLGRLAEQPTRPCTVSELARQLRIPRATCDSLLKGLAASGLVRRCADLRYQLGLACIALGDAARSSLPTVRAAAVHAEALARSQGAVAAVAIREGEHTRVTDVFDFGPPFGIRPRAGDAIAVVPPFGAAFVAWDSEADIAGWLSRAEPALKRSELERYRAALQAVRHRGYSITVATRQQPELISALERLGAGSEPEDARRTRDELVRSFSHSEYLAAELKPKGRTRLTQVSAPVFDRDGAAAATIMLLGPGHELTAAETIRWGERVLDAARRATHDIGGVPAS
jgi:DNA-binding IclR family transcriptional regulator